MFKCCKKPNQKQQKCPTSIILQYKTFSNPCNTCLLVDGKETRRRRRMSGRWGVLWVLERRLRSRGSRVWNTSTNLDGRRGGGRVSSESRRVRCELVFQRTNGSDSSRGGGRRLQLATGLRWSTTTTTLCDLQQKNRRRDSFKRILLVKWEEKRDSGDTETVHLWCPRH